MNRKRKGIFDVTSEAVESESFSEILFEMRFIPYRVEYDFCSDTFRYRGTSNIFDEVKEAEIMPKYKINIEKHCNRFLVTADKI